MFSCMSFISLLSVVTIVLLTCNPERLFRHFGLGKKNGVSRDLLVPHGNLKSHSILLLIILTLLKGFGQGEYL